MAIADDFEAIQKRRFELGGERWPDWTVYRKPEPKKEPEPVYQYGYGWPFTIQIP